MKIARIREVLHTHPFRPFWIHLADGGRLAVRHEDFVTIDPAGRELIVYQTDSTHKIVDVPMITRLEIEVRNGSHPRKKT